MNNHEDTQKRRMGKKSLAILALFLCLLPLAFSFLILKGGAEASEKETTFALTAEEEEKLSLIQDREITIGYAKSSEYSKTEDGLEYGLLVPVKKFLENELDFQVKMVLQREDALRDALEQKKIDLAFVCETEKERSGALFSVPVYENELFYLSNQKGKKPDSGQVIGYREKCREEKTIGSSMISGCRAVSYGNEAALFEAVQKGIVDGAVLGKTAALEAGAKEGIWPVQLPQSVSMVLASWNGRMKEILSIFDRYVLQTEEGEIFQNQFEEEEKNYLKFCLSEIPQGIQSKVQKEYSRILYYAGEGEDYPVYYWENGEKKGKLPEFIAFFEEVCGVPLEEISSDLKEIEELFEEGKVQLVLTTDSFFEEKKMIYFSVPLMEEKLVCIANREQNGDEDYWGITEENQEYFKAGRYTARSMKNTSLLSGNQIACSTKKELMQALLDGKIDQAVIKEGEADYLSLFSGETPFWFRQGEVGEVPLHFAAASEHRALISMMDEVIRVYPFLGYDLSGGGEAKQLLEEKIYQNGREMSIKNILMWISLGLLLLLSGVILLMSLRRDQPLLIIRKQAVSKGEKRVDKKKKNDGKDMPAQQVKKEGIIIEEAVKRDRLQKDLDVLTGLYNRNIFQTKICEIVERNPEALGVFAFIDMDRLKKINQHFGRRAGDEILLHLAKQLLYLTEGEDRIAFRMGGDDFGVFCGNLTGREEVKQFCQRLRDLNLQVNVEGERILANFSIGVSIFNQDAFSILELMECADEAMSCCKENGLKMSFYRKR